MLSAGYLAKAIVDAAEHDEPPPRIPMGKVASMVLPCERRYQMMSPSYSTRKRTTPASAEHSCPPGGDRQKNADASEANIHNKRAIHTTLVARRLSRCAH
jgi:hypothetical protein